MATIDRIRTSGNTPEAPVDLAPLQRIEVNARGPQAKNAADNLVNSLATFSSGLAQFRDFKIKREKETQIREAALLAELNKDLPKGYYREGVQQYDLTRGAIQGKALSSQLLLVNQQLIQQAESAGGTVQDKQKAYTRLLDNFSEIKNGEVRGSSNEYLTGMNNQINETRTQMEIAYIKKLNKDFENEQTTTLRSSIDLFVEDKLQQPREALVDAKGNILSVKNIAPVELKDFHTFVKSGLKTTKFTKEQLRAIWLNRMIEIANTGVNGQGEPIPEVLEHIFDADKQGFKLVFDSELGKAAQEGLVSSKKAYITYHTSRASAADKAKKALSEKTKTDFMARMTKAFINGDFFDGRADIVLALEEGTLESTDASVLLRLNQDYVDKGYVGDKIKFDVLMNKIQTLDPDITMETLQADYISDSIEKEGLNAEQFVKLQDAFNSLTSRENSEYVTAVSDIKRALNALLKAGTENKLSSHENKLRHKQGFDELQEEMYKATIHLKNQGVNPASPQYAHQFREILTPIVDQIGVKYKPIGLYESNEAVRDVANQYEAKKKARNR